MKGILHDAKKYWVVIFYGDCRLYPTWDIKTSRCLLPLHPDETDMSVLKPSVQDKEVEFEIVPVCTNCGRDYCDNLACTGHHDEKYARIIEPEPVWDEIIKEFHIATQQVPIGAPPLIFECWLVENYQPPKKK